MSFEYIPGTSTEVMAEKLAVAMRQSGRWWRTKDKIVFQVALTDLVEVTAASRLSAILRSSDSGVTFAGPPMPREVLDQVAERMLTDFIWLIEAALTRPRGPFIGSNSRERVIR